MNFLLLASFSEVFSYLLYGLLAILILLVMITVHEFGHYIVGKLFHFGIEEFAIGFGPKIFSKTKSNGEVISIRAFPLGGFCSFKGENSQEDDASAFNNKKPYQRILVLIAGAFMNYLLAIVIIMLMFGIYGQNSFKVNKVANIEKSTYSEYRLLEDDIIIKANGKRIYLSTDLMSALEGKKSGEIIEFLVKRKGEDIVQKVLLNNDTNFSSIEDTNTLLKAIGVNEMATTGVRFGFFRTIADSFQYSGRLAGTIFTVFRQLFNGQLGIESMGGTITTITVTTKMIKTGGLYYLLYISSFIGINLAVFNLLPIPALDGSRVIFCLIEWIIGRPVNKKVEAFIHSLGFVILMLFAVFVDLQQCF